ncbi:hypothetical protein PHYPSEUDO_012323 [Phytophthora pseudosyringae]|uniref:Uncharacterized protein n=1 Tax=Phytophthora pseudosyringae TaxID=221518 RepID=A0A8T1V7R6_9STRA|nr:hypothetical protein PHYPSEUDO_012323 [Phytophthora pseudosyringae]
MAKRTPARFAGHAWVRPNWKPGRQQRTAGDEHSSFVFKMVARQAGEAHRLDYIIYTGRQNTAAQEVQRVDSARVVLHVRHISRCLLTIQPNANDAPVVRVQAHRVAGKLGVPSGAFGVVGHPTAHVSEDRP